MSKKDLLRHFWIALAIGLLFRVLSAYFVFGPQALDDYLNQLIPSYKFAEMGAHFLPPWRSPLVIWILAGVINAAKWMGIVNPVAQAQAVYVFIGILSLTTFLGCYFFFLAIEEYAIGVVALYFTAIHGLMPFVSTRAFLESISMGPLTLGAGLVIWSIFLEKRYALIAALSCLGLATLIRFQDGSVYVAVVLWILVFHRKWWKEVMGVSFLVACVNAGIDLIDHRQPFSTLLEYLNVNKDVARYGAEPWYATWVTWLAIGFFPFSLPLLGKVRCLNKRGFREVLGFVLVFVLAHSLISHKEERFIYPVFAMSLWLWAALWVYSRESKSFRRFARPAMLALNFAALIVGCFINTQVGEIGVPARLSNESSHVLYIDRESLVGKGEMWEFFIRSGAHMEPQKSPVAMWEITEQLSSKKYDAIAVMTSKTDDLSELESLSEDDQKEYQCSKVYKESSMIDSLIYKMNPGHNERRRPTWYVVCSDHKWLQVHNFDLKKAMIN